MEICPINSWLIWGLLYEHSGWVKEDSARKL
jgi:hypothetical protein